MGKTKSVVTKYESICIFCGAAAECEHHLVFGNSLRQFADADGIKVPACNRCHNMGAVTGRIHDNPMAERLSKMLGQAVWENVYGTREQFRRRYGQSYL